MRPIHQPHPRRATPSVATPRPFTPRHRGRGLGWLLVLLMVGSIATAQGVRVVDDIGREVSLAAPALRIVSMVPSHTETVCALGACDRLVGRDSLSDAPAAALAAPTLGTAFAPDLEALVALAPDLVLSDAFAGLEDALAPFGIAVYAGTPQGLADLGPYVTDLGALLGLPLAATDLVESLVRGFEDVRGAVAGAHRPRVFVEIDATPYAAGPTSLVGAIVAIAGGEHVIDAALGAYPQVDPEAIVAADPEVILLMDAPYGVTAADVAARPGWDRVSAVRQGRVLELTLAETDALSRPGPRLIEAARALARRLHPERF